MPESPNPGHLRDRLFQFAFSDSLNRVANPAPALCPQPTDDAEAPIPRDDNVCVCEVRARVCVRAPNQAVTTDPPSIAAARSIALSPRIRGRVPVIE